MKSREEYVRPYQVDLEQFIEHVADVCREAGYSSIDDAYESILSHPISEENAYQFNGWNSEEDYWIMSMIDGIYEYEKEFYRAHKHYDRIIERLVSKHKYIPVVAEELIEMKRRDERARRYLEEANSRLDEKLDELVSKYKSDDVEVA
jgi:hypothetical protein